MVAAIQFDGLWLICFKSNDLALSSVDFKMGTKFETNILVSRKHDAVKNKTQ